MPLISQAIFDLIMMNFRHFLHTPASFDIKLRLTLAAAVLLAAGCQMDDIKHYGEKCIGVQAFYSNGELQCSAHDMSSCLPEYADALNMARCPTQDFKCSRYGGASICTSGCPGTQKMVICGGKCYLAKSLSVTYGSNDEEICTLQCPDACPNDCDEYGACKCPTSCTQGCDVEGNCLPCLDFEQSYENDENQVCTKLVCKSGQLKPEASFNPDQFSCNHDKTGVGECLNGKTECREVSGAETLHLCTDGAWRDLKYSCDEGNLCATLGNVCIGEPIGQHCTAQGSELEPCPGDASCNAAKTACGECQNGRTQCIGSVMQECIDGVFQSKPCETGSHCEMEGNKAKCVTNACELGKKKCSNNIIYVCENYTWQIQTACTCTDENGYVSCSDGTSVCSAGETKCENNTQFMCSGGNWQFVQSCLNGCDSQLGACTATCQSGETKCESNTQYTCSNGNWLFVESCQNGCDSLLGTCASAGCQAGKNKCESNTQYVCSGGSWQFDQTCQNGCDALTDKCAQACQPNERACNGDSLLKCDNGSWKLAETCDYGCNFSTLSCYPECRPGQKTCDSNVSVACGADGNWGFREDCQQGCDISTGACKSSAGCLNGDYLCTANTARNCVQGKWIESDCGAANTCATSYNPIKAVCTGTCLDGARTCQNDLVYECTSTPPNDTDPAYNYPNARFWVATSATCDCAPGEKACEGNYLKTCNAQFKWESTNCPLGCDAKTKECKTTECDVGEMTCRNGQFANCINGKWDMMPECKPNPESCASLTQAVCGNSCTPGHYLCYRLNNNKQYQFQCEEDLEWWLIDICYGDASQCNLCND